ncbi:MAG: 2-iminoacetate synthase ThiH [Candidatus Edwardsbacteria bacterium]|nr:2-iminoacetate synthase ThiH [Candidatus Edwardsbacteria bacterium]
MSGFASELDAVDRNGILRRIEAASSGDAERAIARADGSPALAPENIIPLVSPAAAALLEPMAQKAKVVTARRFGRTISIYAPLYISNYCDNACVYCGFSVNNQVARRDLTFDEILQEAKLLKGRRISQLLLVSGESRQHAGAGSLARIAAALKSSFPSLAIELYPLETAEYASLRAAGVNGLTIYQETYDRAVYAQAHPAGPKRDYDYRLEAPERGGSAGFRQIGIGSLLGLNDWRIEAYYLARHAVYLMKHYWKSQVSISFPRLRPAAGGYQPQQPVSERELAQMIFALRLTLPDAGLALSTRESALFRDNMMGLGVTKMSAGSKTSPGGYLDGSASLRAETPALWRAGMLTAGKLDNNLDELGKTAGDQFAVCDDRSVEDVAAAIRNKGYDPVWKDWDQGFENP